MDALVQSVGIAPQDPAKYLERVWAEELDQSFLQSSLRLAAISLYRLCSFETLVRVRLRSQAARISTVQFSLV